MASHARSVQQRAAPAARSPAAVHDVRVECPPDEYIRVRVAISPLASTVACLFEVVGGWRRGTDPRWLDEMLRRAHGIDLAPLEIFGVEARTILHALIPPAPRPINNFKDELAVVAAATPELLLRQIDADFVGDVPAAYRSWVDNPERSLRAYVQALSAWWETVMAPEWPRMLAILETEMLRVGRVLATEGRRAALASIHPHIRWEGDALVWPTVEQLVGNPLNRREILVLPLACGPNGLLTDVDREDVVFLAYGAPGAASLFSADRHGTPDALDAILGRGRASVLRALDGSNSMRAIGATVGLSASTVCTHLHALEEMALVHRGRVGRYVIYGRTDRGNRLIQLF